MWDQFSREILNFSLPMDLFNSQNVPYFTNRIGKESEITKTKNGTFSLSRMSSPASPPSPPINPSLTTTEEQDHLERSKKKIKSDQLDIPQPVVTRSMEVEDLSFVSEVPENHSAGPGDDQDNIMREREQPTEPLMAVHPEKAKSFRDAVLRQRAVNQNDIDKRIAEFDD